MRVLYAGKDKIPTSNLSARQMEVIEETLYMAYKGEDGKPELLRWFTPDALKGAVKRGHVVAIRDKKDSRRVLISFDSIPEATRNAKGMPPREVLLREHRQQIVAGMVHFITAAYDYYLQQPQTYKTAKEKAEQASWLIAIAKAKPCQCRALGFTSKDDLGTAAIAAMEQRGWHAWKCTSLKGLRKKLTPFQKYTKGKLTLTEACASLISGKCGNDNAGKLGTDQHALLVQIHADGNAKPNMEQTWAIYSRKANEMVRLGHWPQQVLVDVGTVRAFLTKPAIMQLWYEARHGHQEYRNVYEPVTLRKGASYANALWVIDGTPSHRYFQHGKEGRYFRFNIFPVLDAHSWCVLGFWLGEQENTEAVLGALRSACMVSGGYLPHQILYDNSAAIQSYRAQDAIEKISIVSFAAKAGNARAKIIENFFHLFNQDVQKFRPGYTANPFALRLDNRPNREALAQMVKSSELPLAEAAVKQAIEDLTLWNCTPRKFLAGKTPLDAYRASVKASEQKQRTFTKAVDIEAFYTQPGEHKKRWIYTDGGKRKVSLFEAQLYEFTNRGLEIVIKGKKAYYDVDDATFRTLYIGQRFTIKYEPNPERWASEHPDEVMLYLNGAPLHWQGGHAKAMKKEAMPMAIADYREGTRALLMQRLAEKKQQRTMVQNQFKALVDQTKHNGTYTPAITTNAFGKKTLNDALEHISNQVIRGQDYKLTDVHEEDKGPGPRADRLSGYDKPLPLD